MRSALFAILVGLVGAALLHIVIILALPQFTGKDAYSRVLGLYEMDSFFPLTSEPGPTGLANDDPFLRVAVCGFSVDAGPARFVAKGAVPFWSLAIYDANSNEIFSMNDHTAVNGNLDLVMATPIQLVDLRKTPPRKPRPVDHGGDAGRGRLCRPARTWRQRGVMRKPCATSWPNPAASPSGDSFWKMDFVRPTAAVFE
jgi:uncharacterized membrane protein